MTAAERRRILDAIREAIAKSDLSAYELAKRSGIDKAALSRFINSGAGLSIESIERIAPALGLEIVVKKKSR
jgi:transcriptional regulator with XRE-family HTH domain